jgi:peptidoglycan-associated lipoprotein
MRESAVGFRAIFMNKLATSAIVTTVAACLAGCTNRHQHGLHNQPAPMRAVPGGCGLCATVGSTIYFGFDSTKLSAEAQVILTRQAHWLMKYPRVNVLIAGNCDERGTKEYNLALGSRRANAARDFLVANGVASARISTVSYGDERPISIGANEQAWAKNRNAISSIR